MVPKKTKDDVVDVRLGLLGLGTVGSGVAQILKWHGRTIAERTGVRLLIKRAVVRDTKKKRPGMGHIALSQDPSTVVGAVDVDVVVELMGGVKEARAHIGAALRAGQSVVTANKAVLAAHGPTLWKLAESRRRDLAFEAAVAGGIPIIRTLREGLASDSITTIRGILNGTTNYLLEDMARGRAYEESLAEAQRLGYAEADPTLDVSGRDAADKLSILVNLAYGTEIPARRIPCVGVTTMTPDVLADADELGYRVKLLGIARRVGGYVDVRVHPTFVPKAHVLAAVPDAQNAIAVDSEALGTTVYQGAGAGGLPTGSAVVADLIEVGRSIRSGAGARVTIRNHASAPKVLSPDDATSAFYLRVRVREKVGVMTQVTKVLAAEGISLASVLQQGSPHRGTVPIVISTHPTRFGSVRKAVNALRKLSVVKGKPLSVPIEDE